VSYLGYGGGLFEQLLARLSKVFPAAIVWLVRACHKAYKSWYFQVHQMRSS